MKRKLFFVLLFTALLFCLFTVCASAETYSGKWGATDTDNVTWTLDTTTGALLIEGTGAMSDFSSSSSTDAWRAYKSNIKSVTITDGVTSIGDSAFANCSGLTSITIPEGVTSIGGSAFYSCSGLTSITIPEGVTSISGYAFGYSGLTSITIPEGVTSIYEGAFRHCTALTEINFNATAMEDLNSSNYVFSDAGQAGSGITVNIGANVTKIPGYLFFPTVYTSDNIYKPHSDFPNISKVNFDENSHCTSIGSYAFYKCHRLTSITIPNSVTFIGYSAFYNCISLASITIPDKITSIGYDVFSHCRALTNITIPDSVTSIYSHAFYGCSSLTSITIPDSVTSIGFQAFSNCMNLTSISVKSGNTIYHSTGNCLIETASKTLIFGCKNSTIPDDGSVTSIGTAAFSNCGGLTSVTIPSNITSIGNNAFHECINLKKITICSDTISCGSGAFEGCYKLIEIYNLSSTTFKIGTTDYGCIAYYAKNIYTALAGSSKIFTDANGYVFYESGSDHYLIGYEGTDKVLSLPLDYNGNSYEIYNYAFFEYPESIVINENSKITSIGFAAFFGCNDLKTITLPFVGSTANDTRNFGYIFGAKSYSDNYYYIPFSLKTVVITGGTSIGTEAFRNCMFLKNITLPDGITSIGEDAFRDCDSLTSIIIPPSVTSIGDGAFYDCNSLRSITFGENSQLTSIGTAAFRDCRSLTSITLPSSVTSTCYYAFYGCSSLTSITIPDSITSIGASAFYGCSSLTSITIPDSVTYISRNAFDGCRSLKSIVIGEKVSSIGTSAFEYCTALDVVYIRSASLLDGFADFTDLGYLLEHCNTVVLYPDSSVPDLISITFPFTEEISYLGTSYTAYSVHEHTWEDCSTHIQCVQDGFRGENCSVCLLTKGENVTAHAFGEWQKHSATQHKRVCACTAVEYDNHNWNSGEITTPATHTTLGVKTFTCSDCGETKTEDVAKLTAHEYGEWQKHDANQHKRVCACAEIDYADHSWNSGVITTPATHLTIGVKTYTCTDCGETKTEDIPKLTAHSYYAWQKHDATQHKHVCACSAVEYEEHNWNSGVITKKPTETEVGVKTFTCTDCGEIKTEEIAKTESNPPSTNSSAGQANSANKDNSSNAKEESLGTGAVIGIVGGSVAVVGGGGFCLYWFVFRKKRLLK